MKSLKINEKFAPLFDDYSRRYILLTGGRGPGKSFAKTVAEVHNSYNPDRKILSLRYTMISAKDSVIPEFEGQLELMGLEDDFDVLARNAYNKESGTDILFRGIRTSSGNQTAKLKSIPDLTDISLEEAEELLSEDDFDTIDFSLRSTNAANRWVIVMNPTSSTHWVYRRWFKECSHYEYVDGYPILISDHPDVLHIHTTYLDNIPNLDPNFLQLVYNTKEQYPDHGAKYHHKFLGAWRERQEGVVIEKWKEGAFDWSLPYVFGMDFGYYPDPTTLVAVALDEKKKLIYVHELLYKTKLTTEKIKRVLHQVDDGLVIADSSEPRLIAELAQSGINIMKASKGPDSVRKGLRDLLEYTIVVTPDSHHYKHELNNYIWNDKKSDTPVDDYNHLIDATRYAVDKIKRPARKRETY